MTETVFAVVNADGEVENTIVADQEFIDSLKKQIVDPDVDTGFLFESHTFYDVTTKDPRPGVGWTRAKNGKFSPPPGPTQDELDAQAAEAAAAQAAEAQRVDDDAFLDAMKAKIAKKTSLTQDERDRLQLIDVSRR